MSGNKMTINQKCAKRERKRERKRKSRGEI